ncbi:MAG: hypothetical protein AAF602_26200 [Myxococcota bacterium]
MNKKQGSLWMIVGLAVTATPACTQFDNVEDACHPSGTVPGADAGSVEEDAVAAMNCYRRVSGLARARVTPTIQQAIEAHASYILQNPDAERIYGEDGPAAYLTQRMGEPGFTGASVIERFDRAGYAFTDPSGVSTREFLYVARAGDAPLSDDGGALLSGAAAMDALMRQADWREVAMQRSWLDGGYTEIDLDATWWNLSGICSVDPSVCGGGPNVPTDFAGRMYYIAVVHRDPPLERSFQPFSFPERDQLEVPLFSASFDSDDLDPLSGIGENVQISYPISIFGYAGDPDTADLQAQNIYGLEVDDAIIRDSNGTTYPTRAVLPGSSALGVFPSGVNLRRSAAVYIDRPFAPSTTYTFTGEVTTNEAVYDVEFSFTTAASDPGALQPGDDF